MAADRKTVLIVDDDVFNRDLLRRLLAPDFDVVEADGVEQALDLLAGGRIDAVLSDQLMDGRCGTDLAAEVAQRWPRLPVLLATGLGPDPDVQSAVERGDVRRVVRKPWSRGALCEAVRQELGEGGD